MNLYDYASFEYWCNTERGYDLSCIEQTQVYNELCSAQERVLEWANNNFCGCNFSSDILEEAIYILAYSHLRTTNLNENASTQEYELTAYRFLKNRNVAYF